MGIDRDSARTTPPSRHDGNYLPHLNSAGMVMRGGGDSPRTGAAYRRQESAPEPQPLGRGPAEVHPHELERLLRASDSAERDAAWDAFLAQHSRLLLHVARKVMPAADSAMDAYANLLERLRRDDCRALAGYTPDGRSRFTTWLVVVARRMCVDFYRQQYGRPRNEHPSEQAAVERDARRRLVSFVGVDEAHTQIVDGRSDGPEDAMRHEQLRAALDRVVSALQPPDQLLLKLRFHDALSAQQIASVLRWPTPFHVYRRLKVLCEELRSKLIAVGVEDSAP